jgi:hypothetical protein
VRSDLSLPLLRPAFAAAALFAAAPAAAADAGCRIALARADAAGIATYTAECRWPVAARFVSAIVGDNRRMEAVSGTLAESRKLSDGRIVQVMSPGWPVDDRQSTIAIEKRPLAGGGLLLSYTLAAAQEPLGRGRVQARRDEGRWEIRPDGPGATRLRYETTYDAGGSLPVGLVQRTVRRSIAETLAALRTAAEASARDRVPGSR